MVLDSRKKHTILLNEAKIFSYIFEPREIVNTP